jgi:hypothetical protein
MKVFVTAGHNSEVPLRQGECILDHMPGKPDFFVDAVMTFN